MRLTRTRMATGHAMRMVFTAANAEDRYCMGCGQAHAEARIHKCGLCFDCCRCMACPLCTHVYILPLCGTCGTCPGCCQCFACPSCARVFPQERNLCEQCGLGMSCGCCRHTNSSRPPREFRFRTPVNLEHYVPRGADDLVRNPSRRLLSAEIELCGFHSNKTTLQSILQTWQCSVVSDGSLPSEGAEINTHPAGGDYWSDMIEDIGIGMASAKAWVNSRAGCHIHVDCRDLDYTDLAKVLRVVGCLECALYALIPVSRANSESYCQYWAWRYLANIRKAEASFTPETSTRRKALLYRRMILQALYGFHSKRQLRDVRGSKGSGARYRGVNIHSFLHRGTIEFRMPAGMIYPSVIRSWGMLLAGLIDYCKAHTMEELIEWLSDLETTIVTTHHAPMFEEYKWSMVSGPTRATALLKLRETAITTEVNDFITERLVWAPRQTNGVNESY